MNPVDVDYNGYVIAAYCVAVVALAGVLAWSVMRTLAARKRLVEVEKDEAE